MPFWSNEDWRARTGSSWCALGRSSIKSKSSISLGGGTRLSSEATVLQNLSIIYHPLKANRTRLLMVVILQLHAVATVMALLLRSGDVEENPGPGWLFSVATNLVNHSAAYSVQ